jgi:LacI family transcriptional regulator
MRTLGDIAKEAGVSVSTVSRALEGSPVVNSKTAEQIRKLAEERGYKVNRLARDLARRQSRVIGVVVPEVENPYFPQLIDALARFARQKGYVVIPAFSGAGQEDEVSSLQLLEGMRARAAIIVTGRRGFPGIEVARSLQARGTGIVVLGWAEGSEDFDNVYADDPEGMAALTRYLIGLGHREILLVADSPERGERDRIRGFADEMQRHGLWREERIVTGIADGETLERFLDYIHADPDRPTAIIGYHDILAARVLRGLQDRGVRVPEEISIAGFDNLSFGEFLRPGLTTVDLSVSDHAASALRLLLERLETAELHRPPRRAVLAPSIVIRASCSAPRVIATH